MRIFSIYLLCFVLYSNVRAQHIHPANSVEIFTELNQLGHLVNVLYIAAHPDDENTRLLSWLESECQVRAAYLSITRGDGGQNILGGEQGAALGLIRTYELLEARKIDGAEQYFTRAIDFGFSKNPEETFKHWNKDMLTGDVAWIFRKFKPDVVICRFPPNAQAGHGQHGASSILPDLAFRVSGDPAKYPEQLKYFPPWQPKRILLNTFRFGNANIDAKGLSEIIVGQYSPFYGMGYGELAGIVRSMHKSQGAGTPSVAGTARELFRLMDGEPIKSSLFDGIDITWNRVGRKDIGDFIERLIKGYNFRRPSASLPGLLELRKKIKTVKDVYWRDEKLGELDKIILNCSGTMAALFTRQPEASPGMTLPFNLQLIARAGMPVILKSVRWMNETEDINLNIDGDSLIALNHQVTIPASTPVTEPYWLVRPAGDEAHYLIPEDSLLGLPETPGKPKGVLNFDIGGEIIHAEIPLSYKVTDPTQGDLIEPLRIVPKMTLEFAESLLMTEEDGSVNAGIRLHPFIDIPSGVLRIMSSGEELTKIILALSAGKDTVVSVRLPAMAAGDPGKGGYSLDAVFETSGEKFTRTRHVIHYQHIPTLQYFTFATVRVLISDWKCTVSRIGYVPGAGNNTLKFLTAAGFDVKVLGDEDFVNNNLAQFDAIITEVRALNVEPGMKQWMPVLLRYAHDGGTLIMQYNRVQGLVTNELGPFLFSLSNNRVTEEDAKVTFTNPNHRLLNYPNKITGEDFNGWTQELGLNFPNNWDEKYETLLEMGDTGEGPLKSAVLYANYGQGHYINTSLSFFRQFPEGNRGAIRLMMNMLSAGK